MIKFKDLWASHPLNRSERFPCRTGGFPTYRNQCAIRMSIALKGAGVTYDQMPRGIVTCKAHPKEYMHYIRAEELARGLSRARIPGIGPVEIMKNPKNYYRDLFGRTGIMLIRNYWFRTNEARSPTGDHIDVWNGSRTASAWLINWFFWAGYYGGYDKATEIWFWEVK